MNPTSEQESILALACCTEQNLMINALAGTGKTTTLEMIERAVKAKPILYLCFNKKIAEDASKRMLSTTTVRTFNSLGHRIWAKSCAKNLALDPKKSATILRSIIDETPKADRGPIWDSFWEVVSGVALAKALGYVPDEKFPQARRLIGASAFHAALDETPDDLTADLIDAVLTRSIKDAYDGRIDYNDQVYMPALFGGTFPRFPLVKVDEVQDLNPVNHALLDKLVKHRLIAVGDPYQSIYGFRGAMQAGMATLAEKFEATPTDLSVSFRCPQAIVENALWRVPHFKWIKEGGHVEVLKGIQADDFPDSSAILCRNNAPLFRLALQLLAAGRSVSVAGSDIGPKLIGLLRKLGPGEMSRVQVVDAIEDWRQERLDRASTTANDLADCMKVFAERGESLAQAISYAEHVLSQKGSIRLMTGHKSKGLEFPIVYHLDPWLCKAEEQDLNLRYVIQTRSLDQYFEINSRDIHVP
jgi:DNA helicase II / ATP-dependent DNA helicase PcrA